MTHHEGGCLCGALRYRVTTAPLWVTACTCHFCQRATGAMVNVLPIFEGTALEFLRGAPRSYAHVSEGSGKRVYVHFCDTCGTRTHMSYERWPDKLGVVSGSFDAPGWFEFSPQNSKFIFLDSAVRGTMVPPGYKIFRQHAATADGVALTPEVLDEVLHLR